MFDSQSKIVDSRDHHHLTHKMDNLGFSCSAVFPSMTNGLIVRMKHYLLISKVKPPDMTGWIDRNKFNGSERKKIYHLFWPFPVKLSNLKLGTETIRISYISIKMQEEWQKLINRKKQKRFIPLRKECRPPLKIEREIPIKDNNIRQRTLQEIDHPSKK